MLPRRLRSAPVPRDPTLPLQRVGKALPLGCFLPRDEIVHPVRVFSADLHGRDGIGVFEQLVDRYPEEMRKREQKLHVRDRRPDLPF